jgi:hypothetical protein
LAVTKPELLIVATAVSLETHALVEAAVPVPESWEVVFGQRIVFPEIFGVVLTEMVMFAEFAH